MEVQISTKHSDLIYNDQSLYMQIRQLTISNDSMAKWWFDTKVPGRFVLAFSEGKLVGWGFIRDTCPFVKKINRVILYVDQRYRRKKIGTKILRRARRIVRDRGNEIKVYRWSEKATKFFSKHRGLKKD